MQRNLSRFFVFAFVLLCASSFAQDDTSKVTSVDPDLLNVNTARVPKEYTIRSIKVTGINTLDTAIVQSISGLQVGDKVQMPGGEAFSKAITNLWKQRLFANVQVFITRIDGTNIDLEIQVQERPRLGSFKFIGVSKSQAEELQSKAALVKSTIITENTKRNATEAIKKFFAEKGYLNTKVRIDETADRSLANSRSLTFYIDKGEKVRIGDVVFYDNEAVSDIALKKQLSGTKEKSRLRFKPEEIPQVYGSIERPTLGQYINNYGFLYPSKTKAFLDPYFRFRPFTGAKFSMSKYEEDKDKVLNYYNAL
ncbi:MAG TPA: POTRA domain-containing protein, partial [Flavisolibacter sp.]|nr:POTRA domain-containing protein [Flavisolibacter sp.]